MVLHLHYHGFSTEFFEIWLNISPPESFGGELFRYLCQQSRLVLQFFGESGQIERIIIFPNNIAYWYDLKLTMDPQRSWSMDAFDHAREQVFTQFATPRELFFHLGRPQVRQHYPQK